MLTAGKLLRNAAVRISDPTNHATSYLARVSQYGPARLPTDPDATCWCAMGAVAAEAGDVARSAEDLFGRSEDQDPTYRPEGEFGIALDLLDEAAIELFQATPHSTIEFAYHVNDKLGHSETLDVFRRAIELDDARLAAAAVTA